MVINFLIHQTKESEFAISSKMARLLVGRCILLDKNIEKNIYSCLLSHYGFYGAKNICQLLALLQH